jgi:hypothetical protein
MAVVGVPFLLAVGRARARIHVEHEAVFSPALRRLSLRSSKAPGRTGWGSWIRTWTGGVEQLRPIAPKRLYHVWWRPRRSGDRDRLFHLALDPRVQDEQSFLNSGQGLYFPLSFCTAPIMLVRNVTRSRHWRLATALSISTATSFRACRKASPAESMAASNGNGFVGRPCARSTWPLATWASGLRHDAARACLASSSARARSAAAESDRPSITRAASVLASRACASAERGSSSNARS